MPNNKRCTKKEQLLREKRETEKRLEQIRAEIEEINNQIKARTQDLEQKKNELLQSARGIEEKLANLQIEAMEAGVGCQELCAHQSIRHGIGGGRYCTLCGKIILIT